MLMGEAERGRRAWRSCRQVCQFAKRREGQCGGWRRMEISTLLQGSQSCGRQAWNGYRWHCASSHVRLKRFLLTLLYVSSASRTAGNVDGAISCFNVSGDDDSPPPYHVPIKEKSRLRTTGFLNEIGTKLRDWAVGQAGGSCYSRAALSSNDSKTL